MTREEAIQKLEKANGIVYSEYAGINDNQLVNDVNEAINMAIEALEQEPKWIPCTERLPKKEYLNYLVSTSDDEVDIGTYGSEKGWSMCDADGFYYPRHRGIEVVAWMPLPEPYKAESEET